MIALARGGGDGTASATTSYLLSPDLPAFDGLPCLSRAFCGALRVARTLEDK